MSLRDIRRQIHSIENVKKITDAMERIAAAQLRRAQSKAEQSRPYITKMKKVLEHLASTSLKNPLMQQREVKKIGLVVIAADKGLSGGYNNSVFNVADHFLKKHSDKHVELMLFGRKGVEYYQRKKWKIRYSKTQWAGKMTFHEIHIFSDQLVEWFLEDEFDEIWIVYTHYINVLQRKIILEKFLNIGTPSNPNLEAKPLGSLPDYIFEPNEKEILTNILPRYCVTRIQTALYDSHASELGARIVAMKAASKNSEDMISRLTLKKNKIRQAEITREMIEISSGAEYKK